MVFTTRLKPAPILQPYISCYNLRVFDTGNKAMLQRMHAVEECYMTFFLKDKYCATISEAGKITEGVSNSLTTIFTEPHGYINWKGDYELMCVQFKSNGFFALFGIPQKILINNIFISEDLIGNNSKRITEQLSSCEDVYQMGKCLDDYFTKQLLSQKHTRYTHTIASNSNTIFHTKGNVSLEVLAYNANMSIRTFERRFVDEVGITPKLYARITRFHNAIDNKMLCPYKNFTAIAHEAGYFDQSHFIKECREFANKTPEELFKYTPPPIEKYVAKVEY